jgi:enterochelin esterase-like enzyme
MRTILVTQGILVCLLFITAALVEAQTAPPTNPAPPATVPARGARGARGPAGPPPSPEDIAEMAKLMDLPAYTHGLGDGDYSVGPRYTPAPERTARAGIPRGRTIHFTMDSTDSKIFPGNPPFKRAVSVYIPSQYVPGTPAPFIVSCDQYGLSPRTGMLGTVLDNMIADHRLPVMCAIMVASGGSERSVEYDTVWGKYSDFVESEVLPRAEKEAGITLTKDPEGRMTYGGSSGGIAAFTMAWFHPELYHRVVSYSGTFVNLKNSPEVPHGGWEYPEHLVPNSPAKPLRVWLHVSQNDNGSTTASSAYRNWVIANKRLAAALNAKGYHYQLVFAKNGTHTDGNAIAQTLPNALEFVWKGYPIAGAQSAPATRPAN